MTLATQILITLATVSVTTTFFMFIDDVDLDEHGHQAGGIALYVASVMAALIYTPVLAYFVWDLPWWLAILATPSAFVTGMFGMLLGSPLMMVVESIFHIEAARANRNVQKRLLDDDPSATEALSWLRGGSHNKPRSLGFFESLGRFGSLADSVALVERFYDAGAEEVFAVQIDEERRTANLVVKLPEAGDKRSTVLTLANEVSVSQGFDPDRDDRRQSIVFIRFDRYKPHP